MSHRENVEHIVEQRGYGPRAERHSIVLDYIKTNYRIENVLDIGSGYGEFLEVIDQEFDGVVKYSLDRESELLRTTKRFADVHSVQADAKRLPFKSESFDLVTALGIIEHVENPTQFVREVHRVSSGQAVFLTPNIGRPNRLIAAMLDKSVNEFEGHKQGWDYHLLVKFLESNGWIVDDIEIRYVDFPLYRRFPRLGRFLSYKVLPRFFKNAGTELFAFCSKADA
ncbi:class I SAM-dependent methyltransferase [Halosimplex pelagicum]|uniref:Class I SAM-dependent methyltransferase n=1 Tax=Halosimplex pelagicum TaxID=869886 RepID=A0A7D5T423_9EURY|nr:class I SAM-dependent methyltransferase [Halosimplex pelagicum]QLH81208.1 class I SAM-dependent methyltransferase [Halosimplex pelagicum]